MNAFFDYIYIRIFKFYNSFENEPSEFSGKILVTFLQVYLLFDLLSLISLVIKISPLFLKIFGVTSAILIYIRLHFRYSNKERFQFLLSKWKKEEKVNSIIKAILIMILYVLSVVLFLFIGDFS